MKASDFFSKTDKELIRKAILKAELNTSGEIRLHVDNQCKGEVLDRAAFWFKKLKMHKTKLRNGVLFYLAVNDRKFAILGDAGINNVTPDDFWDSIKEKVLESFRTGEYTNGLAKGIEMAGEKLKEYFPYENDDINEIPDDISFDD